MIAEIIGYSLALLVGVSLGLVGSGGSILTVPILVYILGIEPEMATAYSLFVVGTTSLVGGTQKALQKSVDFRTALSFGFPSIVTVFLTRAFLVPAIPEVIFSVGNVELSKPIALMILFAVIMVSAAISMIASTKENESHDKNPEAVARMYMLLRGAAVGVLSGLVGAGGGFLIIPALVLTVGLPMKRAVGTSLFIVATQSILGFMGDLHHREFFDWQLLVLFTTCAVFGIFIGISLSKKIAGAKLKSGFGWFVLVMGLYILVKELMLL